MAEALTRMVSAAYYTLVADDVDEMRPPVGDVDEGLDDLEEGSSLMGRVQEGMEWAWGGFCALLDRVAEVVAPLFSDAVDWMFDNQEDLAKYGIGILIGSALTIIVANIIGKSKTV